ncbi:Trm112 family protein [Collinsella sp. CLA-ER-H5]|uniref:Trm112 family protein n=1 Tax=Collinsella sp. CLA-ER-H5 TaxID=3136222 RepID=UPI0032BF9840
MAFESVNYQCPACGGPLHFASAEQKLVCDYCDSRFEVEEVEVLYRERQDKADAKADAAAAAPKPAADAAVQELAQNAGYICSSCGAELISDGTVAVTTCPYCGNPAVAPGQLSGDFSPDLVIPFSSDATTLWLRSKSITRARSCCPRALSPATTSTKSKAFTCRFGFTAPAWTAKCTLMLPTRP